MLPRMAWQNSTGELQGQLPRDESLTESDGEDRSQGTEHTAQTAKGYGSPGAIRRNQQATDQGEDTVEKLAQMQTVARGFLNGGQFHGGESE